jgi:hypothetical protein
MVKVQVPTFGIRAISIRYDYAEKWICSIARHDLSVRRRTTIAETTGSVRGKGQFPEICPETGKTV